MAGNGDETAGGFGSFPGNGVLIWGSYYGAGGSGSCEKIASQPGGYSGGGRGSGNAFAATSGLDGTGGGGGGGQSGYSRAAGVGGRGRSIIRYVWSAAPGAPSNVVAVTASSLSGTAIVSWTTPTTDNNKPITDYKIQQSTDSGSTWSDVADAVSISTTAIVSGLTDGTSYQFRVAAINAKGTGAYSSASSAVTVGSGTPGVSTKIGGARLASLLESAALTIGGARAALLLESLQLLLFNARTSTIEE